MKLYKWLIISILHFVFISQTSLFAQKQNSSCLEKRLSLNFKAISLAQAIDSVSMKTGCNFSYQNKILKNTKPVSASIKNKPLRKVLKHIFRGTRIEFQVVEQQIILKKRKIISYYTVSGYISDEDSGEKLLGTNIYQSKTYIGTSTNSFGFYSISLPKGKHRLLASFVGYSFHAMQINLTRDTVLNIEMKRNAAMKPITILSKKEQDKLHSSEMSTELIQLKSIKNLPFLLGEADLIKTVQLLPGVQFGTEGSSGLYVRGGGPDQNLILLDGVPLFTANHLFGFFSVFNSSAINHVKLIKGGFPARYGGRISSVLDVRIKDGNLKKLSGESTVGLIASQFTLNGPIVKDRIAFLISARRSYFDVLSKPFLRYFAPEGIDLNAGYYFYDVHAKISYKYRPDTRIFFNFYTGKDQAFYNTGVKDNYNYLEDKFLLKWGNLIASTRINNIVSPRLFSNTTFVFSKFNYLTETIATNTSILNGSREEYNFNYFSGITNVTFSTKFDAIPNPTHHFRFGIESAFYKFKPSVNAYRYSNSGTSLASIDTTYGNYDIRTLLLIFYVEDDIQVSQKIRANLGLHYSIYQTTNHTVYYSLQPRFSMRYLLTPKLSLKFAFSKMSQNIHLLTNSAIGLPTDLWLPSTELIPPQTSTQYAIGAVYIPRKKYQLSLELFYKKMNNLIEYKEGANFLTLNEDWQEKVISGKGWGYGMEFLFEKKMGKTTGWIGYTLSWAKRRFLEINDNKIFPYKYDRRHDISLVIMHEFNKSVSISGTWIYGTGNAITLAKEKYLGLPGSGIGYIDYYKDRNGYRMAAYHRLDIGVNVKKKLKWGEQKWTFGIYNLYSRQNPLYLDFSYDPATQKQVLKQKSLFPLTPAVSYSFKF